MKRFIIFLLLFPAALSALAQEKAQISTKQTQPMASAGAVKIDTRLKSGKLDDFKKLEDTSRIERSGLKNLFKDSVSDQQLNLRVIQGPGTSGGGDVLKCGHDKKKFFGQDEIATYYFADTYGLYQSGVLDKRKVLPESVWFEAIFKGLNQSSFGLGDLVNERLKRLKFVNSNGPLEDLPDDQISLNGIDCEKQQLAIQDLATGLVRVDFNLLGRLSYQELYYFKIHEALISLKKTKEDTTSIREELRAAIERVSLKDILQNVLKSYISIPYTSKMLWTLKLLESSQIELWIQPTCEAKKIKDEKSCLMHLLNQEFKIPDINGARTLMSRQASQLFSGSGFSTPPDQKPLRNQIEDQLKNILDFTLALGAYVSPRISIVRKESIDFRKFEEIHLSMVEEIRRIQNRDSLNWTPGLIHWLNEDMERFRSEYYANDTSRIKFVPYDTLRDKAEVMIGECYLQSHTTFMTAANSFSASQFSSYGFGRDFLKCYFARNQPKSLIKKNPQLSAEEILSIVGSALEKDFDGFTETFLQTFNVKELQ